MQPQFTGFRNSALFRKRLGHGKFWGDFGGNFKLSLIMSYCQKPAVMEFTHRTKAPRQRTDSEYVKL